MLTIREELEDRISEVFIEGTNLSDGISRLNRIQKSFLTLLLQAAGHMMGCQELTRRLTSEGCHDIEIDNATRMLVERGFVVRNRQSAPPRLEVFEVPQELATHLADLFDVGGQAVQAADQLSQKRLAFDVKMEGNDLQRRIRRLPDPRLRQVVQLAYENHGVADIGTAGVQDALDGEEVAPAESDTVTQATIDFVVVEPEANWRRRGDSGNVFPREWRSLLEEAGIGTVGPVSLKDYGINVGEPAVIIFQEWIQRDARRSLSEAPTPDKTLEAGIDLFVDLERVAHRLEEAPLALTREKKVPKRVLESLRTGLNLPRNQDAIEADLVESVLQVGQQVGIFESYQEQFSVHPERLQVWRQMDVTRQVELLLDKFMSDNRGTRWSFHQEALRQILVERLREIAPADWVPLDALTHFVVSTYLLELEEREVRAALRQRREENFSRERLNTPFDRLGRDLVYWVVNRLLLLGACELGLWEGKLVGFRLTALGKEVLGISREPRESRILVNPDFEIILFCDGLRGMRIELTLARFADRISAENVRRYRATRESIQRGIRSGLSLSEIREALQTSSDHPLPEPVLVSIEDWGRDLDWVEAKPSLTLSGMKPQRAQELSDFLEDEECPHKLYPDGTIVVDGDAMESGVWTRAQQALREDGWLIR